MIAGSWETSSSGSFISTKPSDSHMAPGWSSSMLSTPPMTVVSCSLSSYGYSNPMGYQTSDFRLLWAITPNPQPPKPPMIGLCPPPPPNITLVL